jgi:hypothetical protein
MPYNIFIKGDQSGGFYYLRKRLKTASPSARPTILIKE